MGECHAQESERDMLEEPGKGVVRSRGGQELFDVGTGKGVV